MAESQPRHARFVGAFYLALTLMIPWLGLRYADASSTGAAYCAANMLLLPVLAIVVTALDVAFTAVAARVVGDRPVNLMIGLGPVLYSRPLGMGVISIRAFPLVGGTGIVTTRAAGQRRRLALANLAGAVPMGVIFAIVLTVAGTSRDYYMAHFASGIALDSLLVVTAGMAFIANTFGAAFVALGSPAANADEPNLRTLRGLGFLFEAFHHNVNGAYALAEQSARRGLEETPDSNDLRLMLATASSERDVEQGFAMVDEMLSAELPTLQRALALNLWAWLAYRCDADALRERADEASRRALDALPKEASVHDTRGHILLWLGRHAEAEVHLRRGFENGVRSTRAAAAAGLALVCVARDRPGEAATWLERGRAEDAHHWLVAKAVAAVDPLSRS